MILAQDRENRRIADRRVMDAELAEVRRYVERLAWAARLGNDSAKSRLRELTFNYIGAEAARLASDALRKADAEVQSQAARTQSARHLERNAGHALLSEDAQ